MKRMLFLAVMGALLSGGCTFKEMKSTPFYEGSDITYTGKPEDRVNLWPVAYHRAPVTSVAWPLLSVSDDHFALRPLYSQYKQNGASGDYDEYNFLWPLSQFDTRYNSYHVFPCFWGNKYFVLFPELWVTESFIGVMPFVWGRNGNFFNVLPCYYSSWSSNRFDHCVFPLYNCHHSPSSTRLTSAFFLAGYRNNHNSHDNRDNHELKHWLMPAYYYSKRNSDIDFWALSGLCGYRSEKYEGDTSRHWALPLYMKNRDAFYSLPYSQGPFGTRYLAGMAGTTPSFKDPHTGKPKGGSSWVMPFYYCDDDGFVTPLCGRIKDSNWFAPLYYRNGDKIYTLPYMRTADMSCYLAGLAGHSRNGEGTSWMFPFYYRNRRTLVTPLAVSREIGGEHVFAVPPLLSGCSWTDKGDSFRWSALAWLAGAGRKGSSRWNWCMPLWAYEKNRSFVSLPYARFYEGSAQTNRWIATPLVGTMSGRKNGEWVFPLYSREKYADFDCCEAPLKADRLPDSVVFSHFQYTNTFARATNVVLGVTASCVPPKSPSYSSDFSSRKSTRFLLFAGTKSYVHGEFENADGLRSETARVETALRADGMQVNPLPDWKDLLATNVYVVTRTDEAGNFLLFKRQSESRARFSTVTRERLSDEYSSDMSLLMWLFTRERELNAKDDYTHTRVLWRLYDYEQDHGDVSLDVFPGFTYDSRTNGYTKTSFLWRLFRYENDPQSGRKVDLLFLPVWR